MNMQYITIKFCRIVFQDVINDDSKNDLLKSSSSLQTGVLADPIYLKCTYFPHTGLRMNFRQIQGLYICMSVVV